ncbi:MAG TPA: hypothetical protein VFG69_06040 [Nannocystaceae bacterium]|nr:hypothetical protein [Nannocystaceae bacterium]
MANASHPSAHELLELHADSLRGLRLVRCHTAEAPALIERLPSELVACEQLLVAAGWDVVGHGDVVWLVESPSLPRSDAAVVRSDEPVAAWLRAANPGR